MHPIMVPFSLPLFQLGSLETKDVVPKAGLEPARDYPTRPSNVRVYQFRHFGNPFHGTRNAHLRLRWIFGVSAIMIPFTQRSSYGVG